MKTAKEILHDEGNWSKIFSKFPLNKFEEQFVIDVMEKYIRQKDWAKLRKEFFDECTMNVDGLPKICIAPHDLFNWFEQKLSY